MSNCVIRNLHRFGPLAAGHYLFYRLAQQLMTLDVTHLMILDLDQAGLPAADPDDYEFRFLTADEVRHFAVDPANQLDAAMAGRLVLGHDFCYAAIKDGKLASYCWLALNSIEASHNRGYQRHSGTAISFPKDMAFRYGSFTSPNFRGQGLYGHLILRAGQAIAEKGVRYVISTTDWCNGRALRSCYGVGHEYLGLVIRFGWGQKLFTVSPPLAARLKIRLGQEAAVLPRMMSTSYDAVWT